MPKYTNNYKSAEKNSSTLLTDKKTSRTISLPQKSLGKNKFIYGTYIEMAFHNFFVNMRHIYAMVFGVDIMDSARAKYVSKDTRFPDWNEDFANESWVWTPMFKHLRKGVSDGDPNHSNPENIEKARKIIERHFPILKAATEYTQNNVAFRKFDHIEILKRLSQVFRVLRNEYSHYQITLHDDQIELYNDNENLVVGILGKAFLGGKRVVKQRFAFDDNAMRCTEQYTYSRRNGGIEKHEIPDFRYRLTQQGGKGLTVFGLVFLCSLFLEKRYSRILTDKINCIEPADRSVVNEIITVYRIRLHQEKLYVSKNTDALAFDILTELRRCPKELFDHLHPDVQQKFRITTDEEGSDDVLMVRKQDRFVHLALKYIDDARLFNNIRFQVSLGKYFYRFYDKYCIDNANEPRVRSLSKDLNGFGRISEIDQLRSECWGNIIRRFEDVHKNTAEENPYVTDHHAQYVINGNRIAMRIFSDETRCFLPKLTEEGVNNLSPTCWMSIYELPAMMFLIHLCGAPEVENVIQSAVANYNRFFNDVAEGRLQPVASKDDLQNVLNTDYNGMRIVNIPEDMVNYLTNCHKKHLSIDAHARSLIESLIEQTNYKLERFSDLSKQERNPKMNKFGKKNYVRIMPGKLADFLAKDIMMFQPNDENNRGRLTGLNFRILQAVLAQYGSNNYNEDYLKRMFTSAHIIDEQDIKHCNPVMRLMWKRNKRPSNTRELYKAYLEERRNYLEFCKKQKDVKNLPFVKADKLRWQDHDEDFYKAKAARYLRETSNGSEYDKALELPRGLFDALIREKLALIASMSDDASDEKKNMAYLIYGYFRKVMQDDFQLYYEEKRSYPVLNLLYRKSPRDPKVYYDGKKIRESLLRSSTQSLHKDVEAYVDRLHSYEKDDKREQILRLLKNMKDNENILKKYRLQDIILFMIAKKILLTDENDVARQKALYKIRLKDIIEKNVLNQEISFEVEVKSKNGFTKRILQNDLKIRDYARFYRFVSDRRMPSLLDHIRTNSIEKALVDKELIGYDKVHPFVLKEVFDYERKYYEQHNDASAMEFSRMINNDDDYDNLVKKRLCVIRNSFAHYSYPPYQNISSAAQSRNLPEKAVAISETFKNDISKNGKENEK